MGIFNEPAPQIQADAQNETRDVDVLSRIISDLQPLPQASRARVIETVITFFKINLRNGEEQAATSVAPPSTAKAPVGFSEDLSQSVKEFIMEKQPETDVERVACLAYYLTHYRETPFFKTLDISRLNTEAALRKFANSTWAVDNAVKQGYLVEASRGQRQLSAFGEQYVRALPDRDSAKELRLKQRTRRRSRKATKDALEDERATQ
jgi:hypothetical protein